MAEGILLSLSLSPGSWEQLLESPGHGLWSHAGTSWLRKCTRLRIHTFVTCKVSRCIIPLNVWLLNRGIVDSFLNLQLSAKKEHLGWIRCAIYHKKVKSFLWMYVAVIGHLEKHTVVSSEAFPLFLPYVFYCLFHVFGASWCVLMFSFDFTSYFCLSPVFPQWYFSFPALIILSCIKMTSFWSISNCWVTHLCSAAMLSPAVIVFHLFTFLDLCPASIMQSFLSFQR